MPSATDSTRPTCSATAPERRGARRALCAPAASVSRLAWLSAHGSTPRGFDRGPPANCCAQSMLGPCSSMPAITAGSMRKTQRQAREPSASLSARRTLSGLRVGKRACGHDFDRLIGRRRRRGSLWLRATARAMLVAEPVEKCGAVRARTAGARAVVARCRPPGRWRESTTACSRRRPVARDRRLRLRSAKLGHLLRRRAQKLGFFRLRRISAPRRAAGRARRRCPARALSASAARIGGLLRAPSAASARSWFASAWRLATMSATGRKKNRAKNPDENEDIDGLERQRPPIDVHGCELRMNGLANSTSSAITRQ